MIATIVKFEFTPVINVIGGMPGMVPSILYVHVSLLPDGEELVLEDRGTIQQLSKKYGFELTGHHKWDFSRLEGRECILSKDDNGYSFLRYV